MIFRKITAVCLTALTAFAAASGAQELRPEVQTVWTEAEDGATLAPDGSRIAFIDWNSGDIAVRNVRTGAVRRLTDTGIFAGSVGFPEPFLVFSPDGKRLVFPFGNPQAAEPFRYELRMTGIDNAVQRVLAVYPPEIEFVAPLDWDAEIGILLTTVEPDGSSQLLVMQPDDGSVRVLEHRSAESGSVQRGLFAPDREAVVYLANDTVQRLSLKGGPSRMLGIRAEDLLGWSQDGRKLLYHGRRGDVIGNWAVNYSAGLAATEPVLEQSTAPGVIAGGRTTHGVAYLEPATVSRLFVVKLDLDGGQVSGERGTVPVPGDSMPGNPSWSPDGTRLAFTLRAVNRITHHVVVAEGLHGPVREVARVDLRVMGLDWSADGRFLILGGRGATTRQSSWVGRINVASGVVERLAQVPVSAVAAGANETVTYVRAAPAGERTVRVSVLPEPGAAPHVVATYTSAELPRSMSVSPDGRWIALVKPVGRATALLLLPIAGGQPRTVLQIERPDRFEPNIGTLPWTGDGRRVLVVIRRQGQRQLATVTIDSGELTPIPFSPQTGARHHPALHPNNEDLVYVDGGNRTELKLMVPAPNR